MKEGEQKHVPKSMILKIFIIRLHFSTATLSWNPG